MITIGCVSLLLLSFVNSVASNCLLGGGGGCGSGLCCSAYGVCGAGAQYCGGAGALYPGWSGLPYLGGDCRLGGCGAGSCCSPYGYCGNSAEYCGGGGVVVVQPVAVSNCGLTGCAAGSCCSSYGYCGNSGAYCGAVAYGNCGATACGAGLCCTRYGYCGNAGLYCALQKSAGDIQPASLEGDFQGQATYYNETKAGSHYSTCGIERGRSLNEDNEKIYGAALNQAQFDPYTVNGIPSTNPVCHKKALVKGPKGEITVKFIDRCPDCNQGDLALTEEAFIAVAGELGNGQTNVEWHFI